MSFQFGNKVSLIYKKLKKGDYEVKPFKAFKKWQFASDNSETRAGVSTYYENYGIKILRAFYPENDKYFGNIANISGSNYHRIFTTQSFDPKMIWYYLDHTFYTNNFPDKIPHIGVTTRANLAHYESSSVFVIPQGVFGEGIKPGSFILNHSGSSEFVYTLQDDLHGNLIDQDYDTSKIIDKSRCQLYVGFNEKYREYNFRNKQTAFVNDDSPLKNVVEYVSPKNITFAPGIPTTSPVSSSGTCAILNGGYFKVVTKENFNLNSKNNFAISFWINVPPTQSNLDYDYNCILDKRSYQLTTQTDRKTGKTSNVYISNQSAQYPFDVRLTNSTSANPNKIVFSQSSGLENIILTSSSSLSTGSWNHVLCQKSGSTYGIWINGAMDITGSYSTRMPVANDREMFIGGNGTTSGTLSGSIDEFRIYNKGLNSTEIQSLSDNSFDLGYAYQSNTVGNVFYNYGMAVISDPRPKYANSILGETGNFDYNGRTNGFWGSFRSTVTFFEHEIICRLKKNEFNFSTNPTLRKDNEMNTSYPKDFATSSFFNPYITTIGLYNDNMDMVAVAKLANPLEKRDDVDMNIIVRFDV
jgi:hypothetical protein